MTKIIKPIEWLGDRLKILDQTELPLHEIYLELTGYTEIVSAIKELKVRGAPLIGISAAYGIALGAHCIKANDRDTFLKQLAVICGAFACSRPTAVNLFYAINIMKQAIPGNAAVSEIKTALVNTAVLIHRQEEQAMSRLSKIGAQLIVDGSTVLTHCNTGQLATGVAYGTALGVIKAAAEQGKKIHVYVDETRPLLQGARLTAWELSRLNIPATLITDNMAGYYMHQHEIDCVIVGADRIAANGDTANKIGTYSLAVLSRENHIPFYVAAPLSSIDLSIKSGAAIPIEERNQDEVLRIKGMRLAPPNMPAANPAFDVTPNKYIQAIITEKGIIRTPFKGNFITILQEGH